MKRKGASNERMHRTDKAAGDPDTVGAVLIMVELIINAQKRLIRPVNGKQVNLSFEDANGC